MADHRASKRPRLNHRGEDDYVPGNIVEIEMHNFMTYDHLTCKPGSRLNLVIGPNGSGKSSLVCAIALGLTGEPQLLGRASSIGAFVKRGEERGYIKISLRGDTAEEKIVIMRKMDTNNKSEWVLNGVAVPKKDVVEVIKKYNIQVNNLTQFLPQDRVCEFAKLTPIQLLEETEKAVGDPDLPVQHRQLIDKSREFKRLELAVKQNGDTLNQLKALNAEQEKDVKRVQQRKKLLDKVEAMKKKLPWLKYDLKKMEYKEAQKHEATAKMKMEEAAKLLNDLKAPIEEQKKVKASRESETKKISTNITQNTSKWREAIERESAMGVQVKAKYKEIEGLKNHEESRQQRLAKAKEDLAAAERELEELPDSEHPAEGMDSLRRRYQVDHLDSKQRQLKQKKQEMESQILQEKLSLRKCSDRLKEMESKNNKLLLALQKNGADKIFEAYNWLQQHRSELKGEVYGPVLLEVNVPDKAHATYLEQHVPNHIWRAFIAQDKSDRDLLFSSFKSFNVPILNYLPERETHRSSFNLTQQMKELGINSRLDQVFDAPNTVKEVLISQFGLDKSYIGSNETHRRADKVSKIGILDFWTPENHYRWFKSRYRGNVSAMVDQVYPSRLFMCNIDASDLEKLRSRKIELEEIIADGEESLKSLHKELRQLEDEMAKFHKEREELVKKMQSEKSKRRQLTMRIEIKRRNLKDIENEEGIEESTRNLSEQATMLNKQRFDMANKIKDLLIEAVDLKWRYVGKHMATIELDMKIREMEKDVRQQEKSAMQAATSYDNCKKETEQHKRQLSDAKKYAESIAIITDNLAQAFKEMPGTVEELEAAIHDTSSEANSILLLNPNVLHEYESRQQQIDAIATKLEADEKGLQSCITDINSLKESWLPMLRNLVERINDTFCRNFQEMAVAGEVSLDEHDVDFDHYGILIKVKFRQTSQLQVLSAHHQSGGERSVSTILYLVSLQDLTNCPFRVVDEINQGMDPINERKMFQQLVRAASQPNTPQCFLLTPKLLPELEYSEACSVLNIMNGPWIEAASNAWSSGDSWTVVMGDGGDLHC
ncbi:Structural maintenance of chromosomes protein 5 [Rhynchospora pubera]|uniref:Structural maintenance of chromosomes protein 5 n=1 Tax=Rhynchospora pubera TaxID=906938 RepID=A0AAV8DJK1_9POAL|nr:Structural maintenance of chromosomes protein 5 [Rhynchospora pubera]